MDYFICGPEAIKDSFGWPNWAPIQIEKLQMRFQAIQSATKIFFRQITIFVLISLSNQRIFTRKISISKKLGFSVKSQHYNIVCNSKITLEIREILLGYQVVGDTPKTKSCINTRI